MNRVAICLRPFYESGPGLYDAAIAIEGLEPIRISTIPQRQKRGARTDLSVELLGSARREQTGSIAAIEAWQR